MTVAEIKEFIDELKSMHYIGEIGEERLYNELQKIKDMLDELEPKAKWLYSADEDEAPYYRCSNCGNISSDGTEDICESCGARMNDELKENNK